jgi:hypothetical protein
MKETTGSDIYDYIGLSGIHKLEKIFSITKTEMMHLIIALCKNSYENGNIAGIKETDKKWCEIAKVKSSEEYEAEFDQDSRKTKRDTKYLETECVLLRAENGRLRIELENELEENNELKADKICREAAIAELLRWIDSPNRHIPVNEENLKWELGDVGLYAKSPAPTWHGQNNDVCSQVHIESDMYLPNNATDEDKIQAAQNLIDSVEKDVIVHNMQGVLSVPIEKYYENQKSKSEIDIVRCKDCKHRHYEEFPSDGQNHRYVSFCERPYGPWEHDPYYRPDVEPDDFCSNGERA